VEPYVLRNFREDFCCKKKNKASRYHQNRLQFSKESLCSFMNSAVNIEFVYLILVGINKFMDHYGSDTFKNYTKKKDKLRINKDRETTKVIMDNLEFKDHSLWNVDQASRDSTS
jgi:hypothetical protein